MSCMCIYFFLPYALLIDGDSIPICCSKIPLKLWYIGRIFELLCGVQVAFTQKKDFGTEERQKDWVVQERRSRHGLAPQQIESQRFDQSTGERDTNSIAEQAKRRAEMSRYLPHPAKFLCMILDQLSLISVIIGFCKLGSLYTMANGRDHDVMRTLKTHLKPPP